MPDLVQGGHDAFSADVDLVVVSVGRRPYPDHLDLDGSGVEAWPRMTKQEVAERLALRIAETLGAMTEEGS